MSVTDRTYALRQSRMTDQGLSIELPSSGWTLLKALDGTPVVVIGGWTAGYCIELTSDCWLLINYHKSGVAGISVINENLVAIAHLSNLTSQVDARIDGLVTELAKRFMDELRHNFLLGFNDLVWASLLTLDDALLSIFASRGAAVPRLEWAGSAETFYVTGDRGPVAISSADVADMLTRYYVDNSESRHPWIIPAAEAGRIEVKALGQSGIVDAVYAVAMVQRGPTYACAEVESGLRYYLVVRESRTNALYFPADDLLLCQASADLADPTWAATITQLGTELTQIAARYGKPTLKPTGVGLYSFGIPHLGHALWQELSAVDIYVAHLNPDHGPARIYLVDDAAGLELYGRIDEIYPEFTGGVVRKHSQVALFAKAISSGISLVFISGARIMQGPRARISKNVEAYSAGRGLPLVFDLMKTGRKGVLGRLSFKPAAKPLVIALGLRLVNRCPADVVGFYVRLTEALHERFGPLIVVIDGISGPDEAARTAAPIYNAARDGAPDQVHAAQDSGEAKQAEYTFAELYLREMPRTGVQVVSCIGKAIKENLFWLSKADFFVAPYGAGLVKVRWIYNKPGFILLSRANAINFNVDYLFGSGPALEPPIAPLYVTTADEVDDLPLEPPRLEPPGRVLAVPHPENFAIREAEVIPRICGAVAAQRSAGNKVVNCRHASPAR